MAVIRVQVARVSQIAPNPEGAPTSMSRDFLSQGAANVASGLFRGLPVGGSISTTSLNVVSGARTRWAAIVTGVLVGVLVALFPNVVSYGAMPALGALLVAASASTIQPAEVLSPWNTGWPSRLASLSTFLATLLLPIQVAVGIGVSLSMLIQLAESSADVSVVEVVEQPDGRVKERRRAKRLAARHATVLDIYGHLYFAGARTLQRLPPTRRGTQRPVVILRLRGRAHMGATRIEVPSTYATAVEAAGGRVYLTGVSEAVRDHLVGTKKLRVHGPVRVYQATSTVGQSTRAACAGATAWLVQHDTERAPEDGNPTRHVQ